MTYTLREPNMLGFSSVVLGVSLFWQSPMAGVVFRKETDGHVCPYKVDEAMTCCKSSTLIWEEYSPSYQHIHKGPVIQGQGGPV
ncbi:hypothetical protein IHE45_07G049300 [Dioscorea alata]|uniref:Uncharacterized protein n=1 Tax=Dioscorea alata TaxID=55571 RepID=A0ACB7VQS4_DIOAL|nr:hypothetical protein IHE45_07G049300 [Dioscorea alata]